MHLWMEESQKLTRKSREGHKPQAVCRCNTFQSLFLIVTTYKTYIGKLLFILNTYICGFPLDIFKARNIPLGVWNTLVHLIYLNVNFETDVTPHSHQGPQVLVFSETSGSEGKPGISFPAVVSHRTSCHTKIPMLVSRLLFCRHGWIFWPQAPCAAY